MQQGWMGFESRIEYIFGQSVQAQEDVKEKDFCVYVLSEKHRVCYGKPES